MFFDALNEALDILTHWRFWAVTFSYGALGLAPLLISGFLMEKSLAAGCTIGLVFGIVWPVIILTGAILLLTPLMLVGMNVIGWDFLRLFSIQQIALIGGVAFAASLLVAIIPFIGRLPSISSFIQVAAMLGIVTLMLTGGKAVVWPGWLMGLGLAVAGGIIAHGLGMVLVGLGIAALGEKREDMAPLLANPIGALVSMVPACLYAGWLRVANGF